MFHKSILISVLFLISLTNLTAQMGSLIRYTSSYAMFPDTARIKGHDYNGKNFDALTHYSDSSILIYIPKIFSAKAKINLVFWFHGWGNMIETACKQFQLLEQFDESARNAVFVFPEGPKNAPDSYGGKLEQPEVFQNLIKEVLSKLVEHRLMDALPLANVINYEITLTGHSGAYRVISKIINKNPVNEVILFDAMYGGNDEYLNWLSSSKHRFINIYTKEGGTFENSKWVMKKLSDSLQIPMISINEEEITGQLLLDNKKIFIFSNMGHNEVITHNRNFAEFLRKPITSK